MNKIIIERNKLSNYKDKFITINKNNISFKENGNYKIEIINSNKLDITIELKQNINVTLFIYSINNNINTNIKYILEENSTLLIYKFYNNKNNKENEYIYLNGKKSKIDSRLSSISTGIEDYNIKIYHNNLNVKSNISNKCIGKDNSKITFKIDSILEKGNTGCYMNQDTKIMSIGNVDAKIEPNMLIDEDDVEARHGSVVGKFNPDNLFYIMSRGIDKETAMQLLIKGFILSHLQLDDTDQERIIKIIKDKIE